MSDTIEQVEEKLDTTDGDHERFSHYIPKTELAAAWLEGREATALCGKKWLPVKDPDKFPVCPTCKSIWQGLRHT